MALNAGSRDSQDKATPHAALSALHPSVALYSGQPARAILPGCEHYAGSIKFLAKAFLLQDSNSLLFDVTADLEDGSGIGHERSHAATLSEAIRARHTSNPPHQRIGLRIHDPQSAHWIRDLETAFPICGHAISYITVPKVRSYSDLEKVVRAVSFCSRQIGRITPIPLHALIETPEALSEAPRIAAHPAVEVLDFGLLDFISEHGGAIPEEAMRSPLQFEHALIVHAKMLIASAAAAHGKVAAHNITTDISSPETAEHDAKRARTEFGFMRMWSIHPLQIEPIVRSMTPNFASLPRASEILLQAYAAQWKPIAYQGTLHDRASYRFYWDLIRQAKLYRVPLSSQIEATFFSEPRPS